MIGAMFVACAGSSSSANAPAQRKAPSWHPPDAPCDLAMSKQAGGKLELGQFPGSVLLLEFFGTYNEPSKKMFPKLNELQARHAGGTLVVLGVAMDDVNEDVGRFVRTYATAFEVCWDKGQEVSQFFAPQTVPATFIFDGHGMVRFVHKGYREGMEVDIEREVEQLLAEK